MNILKANKNKIFFLTKKSRYSYGEAADIILSPELYWVRIFDIPITNKRDMIKVVPTLFEDFLDVEEYKFYAVKQEENKYICFAYNENEITKIQKRHKDWREIHVKNTNELQLLLEFIKQSYDANKK